MKLNTSGNIDKKALSKGIISLVEISFCIKAIAQRHLITNILIQTKGLKMNDICSRNRAFFYFWRFASREKLVQGDAILG